MSDTGIYRQSGFASEHAGTVVNEPLYVEGERSRESSESPLAMSRTGPFSSPDYPSIRASHPRETLARRR